MHSQSRRILTFSLLLTVMLAQWAVPIWAKPKLPHHPSILTQCLAQAQDERVMFNVKSLKYHNPTCEWAQRCTRNCIAIPRSEAIRRGGIPCKVCGGR